MKTTTKLRSFLLIAGSSLLAISSSHAGVYYWDTNSGTLGSSAGATASGTWSSGGTTWNTTSLGDGGTPAYTTLAADDLFFSAGTNATGASAIALTSTQNASSLTFEEGTVTISGASGVITLGGTGGNITVNSGRSAIIGNNTNTIIGGSVGLTKLGAGTLTLNGTLTNTFTGGINVNGGTLALDYANMAASTNLVTSQALTFGGGNLTLKGKSTGDTTQSLGNVTVNAGGGTLLINPSGGTSTTLTLGTLTATAAGGSLTVGRALSAGTGTLAITTTTDKDATGTYGGRLVFANGTANTGYDWATNTGGGGPNYTLSAYSGYTAMVVGATSDALNTRVAGAGIALTGAHTHNSLKLEGSSGTLALAGNLLTLTNGGLLVTGTSATVISGTAGATRLTVGNGSGSYDLVVSQYNSGGLTISAVIGNNGGNATGLTKAGTGTLTLSGSNTYTGNTTVSEGTVKIGSASAFGITSTTPVTRVTVASGATVDFNGIVDAAYGYTISGTGVGGLGALINTGSAISLANAQASNIRLAADATIGGTGNWALIAPAYGVTSLDLNAKTLTKVGANTITLTNTLTTAGNIQVDAGILAFGTSAAVGVTGAASAITLANTSAVSLNVVRNSSIGSLAGGGATGGNVAISNGITFTVGALNTNTSFAGVISGTTGALTKIGTGTQTLSGNNTYTGVTSVSAGTLNVSAGNINASSAINVAAGGTLRYNSSTALDSNTTLTLNGTDANNRAILGGTGTINQAITLNSVGDVLSPGNSPGIQTYTPAQSWASFSYDWEVNNFTGTAAGTDFDQIGISTTLNLTGGSGAYVLNILSLTAGNVDGFVPNFSEINRSWTILTSTGITGFNAANWTLVTDPAGPGAFTSNPTWGGTWALSQSGNNLVLGYTAIPEPGAALIGSLGLLALLRRRRS